MVVGYKVPWPARRGKLARRYQGPCRVVQEDKKGLTYEIKCQKGQYLKRVHYKQLKSWYGDFPDIDRVEDSMIYTSINPPISHPTTIIGVEQQLRNKLTLTNMFREASDKCMEELARESTARLDSTEGLSLAGVRPPHASLQEPQSPKTSTTPSDEVSVLEVSPKLAVAAIESMRTQETSPQMMTRQKRKIYEKNLREQAQAEEACSFSGFDEVAMGVVASQVDRLA